MKANPPQRVKYVGKFYQKIVFHHISSYFIIFHHIFLILSQAAFLDTVEVEDKFNKVNSSNANLQYNELLIRERHEDILALSTEMNQVQEVFRELATVINDQGALVEDIESNVTSAAEQSKQGVRQVLVSVDDWYYYCQSLSLSLSLSLLEECGWITYSWQSPSKSLLVTNAGQFSPSSS